MPSIHKRGNSRYYYASFRDEGGVRRQHSTRTSNKAEAKRIAEEWEKPYKIRKASPSYVAGNLTSSDQWKAVRMAQELSDALYQGASGEADQVRRQAEALVDELSKAYYAFRAPYLKLLEGELSFTGMPLEADREIRRELHRRPSSGGGNMALNDAALQLMSISWEIGNLERDYFEKDWSRAWQEVGKELLAKYQTECTDGAITELSCRYERAAMCGKSLLSIIRSLTTQLAQNNKNRAELWELGIFGENGKLRLPTPRNESIGSKLYWYMACCYLVNSSIAPHEAMRKTFKLHDIPKSSLNECLAKFKKKCRQADKGFEIPDKSPGYNTLNSHFAEAGSLSRGAAIYIDLAKEMRGASQSIWGAADR